MHQPFEGGYQHLMIGQFGLDVTARRALHLKRLALHLDSPSQISWKLGKTCRINGLMHACSIPENPIHRQRDRPQEAG